MGNDPEHPTISLMINGTMYYLTYDEYMKEVAAQNPILKIAIAQTSQEIIDEQNS